MSVSLLSCAIVYVCYTISCQVFPPSDLAPIAAERSKSVPRLLLQSLQNSEFPSPTVKRIMQLKI